MEVTGEKVALGFQGPRSMRKLPSLARSAFLSLFLRQGLLYPQLIWNISSSCLCLPSAGMTGLYTTHQVIGCGGESRTQCRCGKCSVSRATAPWSFAAQPEPPASGAHSVLSLQTPWDCPKPGSLLA